MSDQVPVDLLKKTLVKLLLSTALIAALLVVNLDQALSVF